jgi:hypothetical protein
MLGFNPWWGANTVKATPHFARANFIYETRNAPRASYIAGSLVSENLRLQRIDTSVDTSDNGGGNWSKALAYSFTYGVSPSSGRDLLKSVNACDATLRCLPETTFSYGEPDSSAPRSFVELGGPRDGPNLGRLANVAGGGGVPAYNIRSALDYIITADFDGDGKTDIMERYRQVGNGGQQHLYQSNADGMGWSVSTPLDNISGDAAIMEVDMIPTERSTGTAVAGFSAPMRVVSRCITSRSGGGLFQQWLESVPKQAHGNSAPDSKR